VAGLANSSLTATDPDYAFKINESNQADGDLPPLPDLDILEVEELFSVLSDWEHILKDCPEIVEGTSKDRKVRP